MLHTYIWDRLRTVAGLRFEIGAFGRGLPACRALRLHDRVRPACERKIFGTRVTYVFGSDPVAEINDEDRWASREQLDASTSTPEFGQMMSRLPDYFEGTPTVVVYEALPGGEDTKGSLAGAAHGI